MNHFVQRIFLGLAAASAAGCSNMGMPSMGGMFGGDGNAVSVKENRQASPNSPLLKYAASIRIMPYTDERNTGNSRKIGTGAEHVSGMSGRDILLDQDAAALVAVSMKNRLDEAGFQVTEAPSAKTMFELSGVVKELTYDVKERDEIAISVETTLKDVAANKVVWSGVVVEKTSRFAGVSGNNKFDIASNLRKELGIVTTKTSEAISASLMASRPELFNLTPGTKAIPGVTVLVAPEAVPVPTPAAAMQSAPPAPAPAQFASPPASAYTPQATATNGLLLVNTIPARAKVYLDGVYYGLSPLRLELDPGIHSISVKLEGYKMVSERVSVRKGDSTEMNLDLER